MKMSWAVEEWKEGLPTKALQKIQEIEVQLDKLKKERQQRQFQVETLEAALLKQKQKVENEKSETSALKREHQTLIDSCENLEKTRQRISHELQVKESQVNYLEGQLASSKKLVEKLEQENKRHKSEIERCQTILKPADGTPQNNLSRSISPNKNVTDSKLEEMQEKYSKDVEERSRLEIELKTIQAKLFNQAQSRNTISQRNIARQQSSSSVFPWQHDQTPSQHASHSLETPLKGVGMNLQWEKEETPFKHLPKSLQKGTCSSGWFNNSTDSSKQEEQLKSQNQELQARVLDLEFRLAAQEKEVKNHMNKLHEIQFQFEKAKTDLSEKERKLTKMTAQCEQSSTKCVMVEQKLKQVSEELSCCRQNAESTRRNVEQKLKDKEKEFQEEIAHHQHSLRSLDQQSIQTKNKLNQELQQAKKDYNILQLDIDKLSACKQKLEKEMDEIKQQLRHSDQMLKENQSKEDDLKKKLEDVQKERNSIRTQLHQNTTQIHKLENELQKTKQDFNRACSYGEEMKNKNTAQEIELKDLRQQLDEQSKTYITVENLKQQISQLKTEQDAVQKNMRKKEGSIEQLNAQIGTMQNTTEELQKKVQLKETTCQELKEKNSSLAQWKAENTQALDHFKREKEGMENKIKELEQNLQFSSNRIREQEHNLEIYQCKGEKQAEALRLLEDEKEKLRRQIDDVKEMLGSKTLELEKENQAFEELTKKARQDEGVVENLNLNISQLVSQIGELEKTLQQETNKVVKLEESQHVLNVEYENLSNMAKSKDYLIEVKEMEILNLKSSISQITHNFEEQLARIEAEKKCLMEEHEKGMFDKVEIEVAKSALENEIIVFKEQIHSQDSLLKLEKHVQSELQNRCEILLKVREELEVKIEEAGKKYENLKAEMEEEINKLTMQLTVLQVTVNEKDKSIQNFTQELENNLDNLKCLQITNKELETRLEVHRQSEKSLQEKEELISLREKTLERLSEENDELKVSINNLMQEKLELNKQNSSLVVMMEKKEEMIEEFTKYKEEIATKENMIKDIKTLYEDLIDKQRMIESTVEAKENDIKQLLEKMNERESTEKELVHECTVLEEEIKNLRDKYTAAEKKQNFLEEQLCESANVLLMKSAEVEELERKRTQDSVDYNVKIVSYEEKVKASVEEIGNLQSQLERTKEINQLEKELAESSASQDRILDDYNQLLQDKEQLTHLMQSQAEKENGFAAKIEKLENDLATAESENVKNSKLFAEKVQISDQLRDTIITKEVEIQRLQAQLQLLQMDLEDKEVSSETCMAQLNQMQTDVSILETKFQHSEENRLLLENKVSTMQEEMEALHLRISEIRNNEESLLQEVSLQKKTIEGLKSELEKQEQDFHSLESQLNESQAKEKQYHLKEGEMLELQDKLARSETQVMELIDQKSNMEFQLDCLKQELNAQMQSTLNDVKTTLQRSEEQRVFVQQDLNKAQSDLQQSEEQRVLMQQDLNKAQSDLQQSEEQRVFVQQDLSKAQSDLQQSEEQRVLVQQDFSKVQSDLQQSEEQRVLMQQDFSKVQSDLQQSEEQRVLVQQNLSKAQSDLQQSEEQRVLMQQDFSKVQSDLQQSEEQRVLMQQNLSKAQSDLQQSEEQRVLVQQNLSKVQSDLQQSEEQRFLVQQDLSKAQSELQQSEEQRVLMQQDLSKVQSDLQQSEEQRVLMQQDLSKVQSDLQQSEEQRVLLQQDLSKVQSELSANHLDLTESSSIKSINGCENSMQYENKNMTAEKYTVFLQEFSLCQRDGENVKVCLQQMDKKHEDLEKACKILQHEKSLLVEENDNLVPSFDMCGKYSSMAEKSHISTNETRHSGFENIFLQPDLQRLKAKDENSITCPSQNKNAESLNILDELQQCDSHCNPAYTDLKHSNAQLKEEIMKLKQQLSSCQHQNKNLHEQHCNIVSKVTELQSIIAALQTEKVILLDKVNVIKQNTDAGASVYTKLNEIINMSQETKHQNLTDEMACSVENDSSDGNKNILNRIEKQGDAVKEVEAKLSFLKSDMMESQAALSGTKIEKETLQAQLTMLEYPLESVYLHISELKEHSQQLQMMIQEKDNELILLHQQLKENSANLITNDQAASFEDTDFKMNSLELESCCMSSEQSIILLREQLQKQQADADAEIQKLQNTITATRQALESLKYQHASEMEKWQLKLSTVTTEMENKLAAQKQQTELLSAELEDARIQLQTLDLGSQSLLNASNFSEENTSQKLTNTSSAQQKGMNITAEKLEFVNVPINMIPESKVQSQEKTALPLGPLEKKVLLLEDENHCLSNELQSSALENQILSNKAKKLEEELSDVTTQLQVDKGKVFEMAKILESQEMDKRDKKEQFLELEMELKRTKSNKTNLENHILEMEIDLDELQLKKHTLEKERESIQQTIHVQAEKLTELEARNNMLIKDLDTLVETNEKLEQTNKSLKTKVQEFEAEKIYNANTNGVLEEEITKLTSKLQTVAEQMEQVSTEKKDLIQQLQYMEKGAKLGTEGEEELKKQLNQLKEENLSMREQTENLQNKISVLELENFKLLQSLESSLLEKSEVSARLNSTKAEVAEMRHAIEKLKVRIEADQKKSHDMAEKLKERDRKADSLQDKIEALERELQASEESIEDLVLQAETAKEQVEELEEEKKTITEKLELLIVNLNTLSTEKQDLEKQLQQNQEQLENHCSNLLTSEAAKIESLKLAEAYEGSINELQTQISHLNEKVKMCHEELETLRENEKNYLNQNSRLECEKVQLSNQVQDAAGSIVGLQSAYALLNKDLQLVRQKLDEHINEKEKLQQQIVDLEKLKQNNSTDVCNLQIELESLKKESQNLQKAAADSQQAARELSAKHNTMQITKETSEKQLQKELQVAQLQASALLHQVNGLTENNNKLQSDLSFANEKLLKIQQDIDTEKNSISAQLEEFRSQAESFKTQLEFAQSENYKLEKHEAELQTCQEKIAGMKEQLTAKEMEINNLKSAKESANTAFRDDNCKVEELQKSIGKLRRDKDCAQSKLLLWMKSCKQFEHEKESLKRHIQQQEQLLTKLQKSQKLDQNTQIEELSTEMEELKETLEEKTKEADENMEKYWNLIKSMHKLEEENEMLKGRVSLLNNKLQQPNSWNEKSVVEQPLEVTAVHQNPGQSNSGQTPLKSPNVSSVSGFSMDEPIKVSVHKRSPDVQIKHTAKRFRGVESKKEEGELKREAHQNCLKQTRYGNTRDETSYKPEDLLEKVKKGFEEVPSASTSPCTLRQSTLFNRVSSSLSAQSKVTPRRQRQHKGVVQTAKGSHVHQHPTESTCSPSAVITAPVVAEAQSPLSSLTNSRKKKSFVKLDGEHSQSKCSLNAKKSIEDKKQHKEQIADTGGNENCKVQ